MIRGGNIGAMDVFLTIQESVVVRDSVTGEEVNDSWADVGTLWGERIQAWPQSLEKFEGDQVVALKTYRLRTRYFSWLTEGMRAKRGSEISYIKGIEEIDRKKFLILTLELRDNASDTVETADVLGMDVVIQDEGVDL